MGHEIAITYHVHVTEEFAEVRLGDVGVRTHGHRAHYSPLDVQFKVIGLNVVLLQLGCLTVQASMQLHPTLLALEKGVGQWISRMNGHSQSCR